MRPFRSVVLLAMAGMLVLASSARAEFTGLWAGSVTVNKVSENGKGKDVPPTAPTLTAAPLELRVLIHLGSGAPPPVKLLEDAVLMWQAGTTKACSDAPGSDCPCNGNTLVTCPDTPGHYVIVTDHRRIVDFQGTDLRNGELVGRRISSVGFDFGRGGGPEELQYVDGTGSVDAGGTGVVTFTIDLPADDPANPFVHRYHPDHDDPDTEVPALRRSIELTFSPRYPADPDQPEEPDPGGKPVGWGLTVLGGTYRESVRGLLKDDITLEGFFTLTRVAETATLNE